MGGCPVQLTAGDWSKRVSKGGTKAEMFAILS